MSEVTADMIARGGQSSDPEATQLRRRQAVKVREARQRLTSTGWDEADPFEDEMLRLFAENRRLATPALGLLILAIGGAACLWISPVMVGVWVALLFLSLALPYLFAVRYLAVEGEVDSPRWRRMFALAETIHGLCWALLVGILIYVEEPTARSFVMFVLLLVSAVTAIVSAAIPLVVYAGVAPLGGALLLHSLPAGGGVQLFVLTALAIGAQLCFVVLASRLRATSLEGLVFRREKDALIAELEQAKANSDEARRRAEDANLAKSRFLATMSHELRTPLNAILGFSEVMKNELFGGHAVPAYRDYSSDIHGSGQHLLMLINEILDLSRVEAGRYDLKEEAVNLGFVVDECNHLLSLRAKKKTISVQLAIEEDLPRVWVDERAMRQVALNLLSNAIKFTPQGGSVTVKVGWTGAGGQYVSIRDTGPGIPPDEIPVVMSSFGRGSMAHKQAEEGTGLGLPIVKGLVELHGGTFTLKSKVREGTEVIFILPPERVMNALPHFNTGAAGRERPRSQRLVPRAA